MEGLLGYCVTILVMCYCTVGGRIPNLTQKFKPGSLASFGPLKVWWTSTRNESSLKSPLQSCVMLYPQYDSLFTDLQNNLLLIDSWCLRVVSPIENRASTAMALSVTRDNRTQSYVAHHGPSWLSSILQANAIGQL